MLRSFSASSSAVIRRHAVGRFSRRCKSTAVLQEEVKAPAAASRRGLWARYCHLLTTRPVLVKCTTGGLIFFSSDLTAQAYINRYDRSEEYDTFGDLVDSFDLVRASSGAAFGVFGAAYLHVWWGFLERFVERRVVPVATSRLGNALAKVVIDQGVNAPIYYHIYYVITYVIQSLPAAIADSYGGGGAAQTRRGRASTIDAAGVTMAEAHDRASDMIWPTMVRHWSVWPALHTLNFYYVPFQHRVLVQNLALAGWSGYLSHLSNGGLEYETLNAAVECHPEDRIPRDARDPLPGTEEAGKGKDLSDKQERTTQVSESQLVGV